MSWVDCSVEKANKWLNENVEEPTFKNLGEKALKVLRDNKDDIESIPKDAFKMFVSSLAGGSVTQAKLSWIAQASADELIADMNSGSDNVIKQKQDRDKMVATAIKIAKELGFAGARVLLPLLMG